MAGKAGRQKNQNHANFNIFSILYWMFSNFFYFIHIILFHEKGCAQTQTVAGVMQLPSTSLSVCQTTSF